MYYSGETNLTHLVKKGETLTSIARKYGFSDYLPIFKYNQPQIKNKDMIYAGKTIVIPRSKAGYDKCIKKLEQLKIEMMVSGEQVGYQLDATENDFQAYKVGLDFASDVLTTVAPMGVAKGISKANQAGKLSGLSKKSKHIKRIINESEEMAKNSTKALTEKLGDTVKGVLGGDAQQAKTTAEKTTKAGKDLLSNVSKMDKFLSCADVVLDYVKPSKLANFIVKATAGESVDETIEGQREMIKKTVNKQLQNLNDKINRLKKERDYLYGISQSTNQLLA